MADYTNTKQRFLYKKVAGVVKDVGINRSESFDDVMDSIREGYWSLPGSPPLLSPGVETLISNVTALKRDIEERRTASGMTKKVVWRRLRSDHLAHSMLYLKVAIEIDTGAHHKIVVIGAPENEPEAAPDETLGYWPKPDIIARIVPRLAEVPQEQAQFYFEQIMQKAFNVEKLPMPLKHKLRLLAKEDFSMEDIEWVLSRIASFGNAPIPHYPAEEKETKVTDTPKFRFGG